jgi:hypothetical protein
MAVGQNAIITASVRQVVTLFGPEAPNRVDFRVAQEPAAQPAHQSRCVSALIFD